MTSLQFRTAIDRLSLSQRGAAKFFGVYERTTRRWVSGETPVPEAVAKLLRLMIAHSLTPDEVS